MGCDIHLYLEKKVSGKWEMIPSSLALNENSYGGSSWSPGRDYWLFGVLAGVRAEWISPISSPRGLPDNLSKEILERWEEWGGDAHTPSYYYLEELLKNKDNGFQIDGYVDLENYRLFKERKYPEEFDFECDQSKIIISNQEMERRLELMPFNDFEDENNLITQINFEYPYRETSPYFWDKIIPAAQQLGESNKIRFTFWFDN